MKINNLFPSFPEAVVIQTTEDFKKAAKCYRKLAKKKWDEPTHQRHLAIFHKAMQVYLKASKGEWDRESRKVFQKLTREIREKAYIDEENRKARARVDVSLATTDALTPPVFTLSLPSVASNSFGVLPFTHSSVGSAPFLPSLPFLGLSPTRGSQVAIERSASPLATPHTVTHRSGSLLVSSAPSLLPSLDLPAVFSSAPAQTLNFQLDRSLHRLKPSELKYLAHLRKKKSPSKRRPEDHAYSVWMQSNFGNSCICLLRQLANDHLSFPLSKQKLALLSEVIETLRRQKDAGDFHYHSIATAAFEIFELTLRLHAKAFEGLHKNEQRLLKKKTNELLNSSAMRLLELLQIRSALSPLMAYLNGQSLPSIETDILNALSIFRRWGLIDQKGKMHQQNDMMELLNHLHDRLVSYKLAAPQGFFQSEAEFVLDSDQWKEVAVTQTDQRELIHNWHKRQGAPVAGSLDLSQQQAHFEKILQTLDDSTLKGLLPTLEEDLEKPHRQSAPFYGFTILPDHGSGLIDSENNLTAAIQQEALCEIDALTRFYIDSKGGKVSLKRLEIPLQPSKRRYEGSLPPTLFISRSSHFAPVAFTSESSELHPAIDIPRTTYFQGVEYQLSSVAVKLGSQHEGHYLSFVADGKCTLRFDSLSAPVPSTIDQPLHELASGWRGVIALCYQRADEPTPVPLQNLVQPKASQACHLLQVACMIWKKPAFASINGLQDLLPTLPSEKNDPSWKKPLILEAYPSLGLRVPENSARSPFQAPAPATPASSLQLKLPPPFHEHSKVSSMNALT